MRVGFVQNKPIFGERDRNLAEALELAASLPADLLVLPELFASGYLFSDARELHDAAEPTTGPTLRALARFCRSRSCFLIGGFPERAPEGVFNSAAVVGPEGLLGLYRKTHLFNKERELFQPGDTGFRTWRLGGIQVGVMICFDWCFPEAARSLVLAGAELLAHPSNLVLPHGQRAMRVRSLENRVFSITANRTGSDLGPDGAELRFTGGSQITDIDGTVLAKAPPDEPRVEVWEIDPARARDKWVTPLNDVIQDRRPELYRIR